MKDCHNSQVRYSASQSLYCLYSYELWNGSLESLLESWIERGVANKQRGWDTKLLCGCKQFSFIILYYITYYITYFIISLMHQPWDGYILITCNSGECSFPVLATEVESQRSSIKKLLLRIFTSSCFAMSSWYFSAFKTMFNLFVAFAWNAKRFVVSCIFLLLLLFLVLLCQPCPGLNFFRCFWF